MHENVVSVSYFMRKDWIFFFFLLIFGMHFVILRIGMYKSL